jgi:vacuolar-type H+-ATPase subunit D/Vma8
VWNLVVAGASGGIGQVRSLKTVTKGDLKVNEQSNNVAVVASPQI